MRIISMLLLAVLLQTFVVVGQPSAEPEYDLVITNARIVDGTGNPWFRGDIAIKDGRIAKIGRLTDANTRHVIDAKNNIVAPVLDVTRY